jgi:hypothetical protein
MSDPATFAPTSPPTHQGGCHCGRVRIEVDGAIEQALICNCSICVMKGYLHWIVSWNDFRLLTPEEDLSTYRFNTMQARHHFCPVCGVAPFYVPRSDPDKVTVNLNCVEGIDRAQIPVVEFDGRHWEQAFVSYRRR